MPEIEYPVKAHEIDYTCDECGEGLMRPTGASLMTSPPYYPHVCTVCRKVENFRDTRYPYTVYLREE